MKRVLAAIITGCILFSLAACGSSNQSTSTQASTTAAASTAAVPAEEIEMTIWNDLPQEQGVQKNPIADEIAKKTGVRMNVVNGDDQKFKVLLAGGDLPEIIFVGASLIPTESLLPLDDLIAQHAPNVARNFPKIMEYSQKFLSTDGKAYFLPVHMYSSADGKLNPSKFGSAVAWFGRWDIYSKIGYPQPKNEEEFLAMLKQMQEAYSKTPEGKKVYAISGWTDWGIWPFYITEVFNKGNADLAYANFYNKETGKLQNLYASQELHDGIKFFNKAYNMGIVDPDMFTMNFDTYYEKLKGGQILTNYASWWADGLNADWAANGKPDMGFELIPYGGKISDVYYDEWPLGWLGSYAHAITKNCKNPQKAVEFINFLFSEEGAKLVYRGIEGTDWEMKDGKAQYTQNYLDAVKADSEYRNKQGFLYSRLVGYDNGQILSDGAQADLASLPSEIAKSATPIDKAFCEHYGSSYTYPGEAVAGEVAAGRMQGFDAKFYLAPMLTKTPSDDVQKIITACEEYFKANIAKLVMAKNDTEFENIYAKMMEDLKAKGYDKVQTEMAQIFADAEKSASEFSIK